MIKTFHEHCANQLLKQEIAESTKKKYTRRKDENMLCQDTN